MNDKKRHVKVILFILLVVITAPFLLGLSEYKLNLTGIFKQNKFDYFLAWGVGMGVYFVLFFAFVLYWLIYEGFELFKK